MSLVKRIIIIAFIGFFSLLSLNSFGFIVRKIRIEGLQRIPVETVLNYLTVREGQDFDLSKSSEIIQTLYQTGFFSDVKIAEEDGILIIYVVERPVIGSVHITGNKEIETKILTSALKDAGIAEGLPYDNASLTGIQRALEQQYNNLGRYDAAVKVTVIPQTRNRVAVNIDITEGKTAKIRKIIITGNKAFSQRQLMSNFQLTKTRLWSFFTGGDHYSRQKLDQDLEALRTYYMDRGYLKFKVNSSQVSITPDKRDVYITIDITEGPLYTLQGYKITGDVVGDVDKLKAFIPFKAGQVFSRKQVLTANDAIRRYYADQGYAMTEVTAEPTIDDVKKQIFFNFKVTVGKRIYIRRIEFTGNTKTSDEVLRRELRQMEGGLYSTDDIEESRRRLANLGYLENIQIRTKPVPGRPDQVDLEYVVTEASSGTGTFQLGYSDAHGFLYGGNISQTNFLGTGRRFSAGFQQSAAATTANIDYFNPYYSISGVGRGFSLYAQRTTPGRVGIAPFTTDTYGAAMTFAMPVSEYSRLDFGFGYDNIKLHVGNNASTEMKDFVREHGSRFDQPKFTLNWLRSTYDRAILPTRGSKQSLSLQVGLPFTGRSLDYYKLAYDGGAYYPLVNDFILHLHGQLGYGNGYGNTNELPFFRNFYAGGIDTVRGYDDYTLGPRDSNGDPIGGNILTIANLGIIFPNPFGEKLRTTVFADAGNVFKNDLDLGGIRTSAGIQFDWISPMGPLRFSFAKALNPRDHDVERVFQFSVGASF